MEPSTPGAAGVAIENLTKSFGDAVAVGGDLAAGRARRGSPACSDRTAPARPPRCGCWPASWRPPAGGSRWPASRWRRPRCAGGAAASRLPHRLDRALRAPDRARAAHLLRRASTASTGRRRGGAHRLRSRARSISRRCSTALRGAVDAASGSASRWRARCCTIPPVLILDEPTVGLDVLASRFLREFVRAERDRGKAVMFSTHYLAEAELLCDRIGLLHRGRMLAEGQPGGAARARRRRRQPGGGVPALVAALEGAGPAPAPAPMATVNLATVGLVAGKELRETLRDRRTLARDGAVPAGGLPADVAADWRRSWPATRRAARRGAPASRSR